MWIDENVPEVNKQVARDVERRWFSNQIASLEAYAFGKGEPPTILYRSGRLNTIGMKVGLMAVQTTLADAYFNGLTDQRDIAKSAQLLLMSAKMNNRFAASEIAFKLFAGEYPDPVAQPLCQWLKITPPSESGLSTARLRSALTSDACNAQN
jgi:TPR repeat protein